MRAEDPIVTAQKWREMRDKATFAALILAPLGALMIAADVRRKRDPIQSKGQNQGQSQNRDLEGNAQQSSFEDAGKRRRSSAALLAVGADDE